jgi:hypothetical protein
MRYLNGTPPGQGSSVFPLAGKRLDLLFGLRSAQRHGTKENSLPDEQPIQAERTAPESNPASAPASQPRLKERLWWAPIAISVLALLVSGLSAYYSHGSLGETTRNREVNEMTGRAYVSLSSLLIDTATLYKPPADLFREVRPSAYELLAYLTVTNTGRTGAKSVRIERAVLWGTHGVVRTRFDGAIKHVSDIQVLAPGSSQTIRMDVPVLYKSGAFDQTDRQWGINFTVAYQDGIHQRDQVEVPMLCAAIPDKPQKTLVTAYTCNQEIHEIHEGKP